MVGQMLIKNLGPEQLLGHRTPVRCRVPGIRTDLLPDPTPRAISKLRESECLFDLVVALPGSEPKDLAEVSGVLGEGGAAAVVVPQEAKAPGDSYRIAAYLEAATGLRLQAGIVWTWSVEVRGTRHGKYRQNRSVRYPDSVHSHLLVLSRNLDAKFSLQASSVIFSDFGRELPPTWMEGEEPDWIRHRDAVRLGAPTNKLSVMADAGFVRDNGRTGADRRYCSRSVRRWVRLRDEGLAEVARGERGYPWQLFETIVRMLPGTTSMLVLDAGRGDAVLAAARLALPVTATGISGPESDRIRQILSVLSTD